MTQATDTPDQYSKEIDGIVDGLLDEWPVNPSIPHMGYVAKTTNEEVIAKAKAKLTTLLARAETDGRIDELESLPHTYNMGDKSPRDWFVKSEKVIDRITALKAGQEQNHG